LLPVIFLPIMPADEAVILPLIIRYKLRESAIVTLDGTGAEKEENYKVGTNSTPVITSIL